MSSELYLCYAGHGAKMSLPAVAWGCEPPAQALPEKAPPSHHELRPKAGLSFSHADRKYFRYQVRTDTDGNKTL